MTKTNKLKQEFYTAELLPKNFRDVDSCNPRVLLTNIINQSGGIFRNHCWISIENNIQIKKLLRTINKEVLIKFLAKEYFYTDNKKTLIRIKNIEIINKKII